MKQEILALRRTYGRVPLSDWNALLEHVAKEIVGGIGIRVSETGDGIRIDRREQTYANAASTDRFQIINASEAGTAKITLIPGTVDSMSPVIGSTAIDTIPAPKLTLTNSVKNIIVLKATFTADTTTADGYTWLLSNGDLSDPEILAYADGSVPADTAPTAESPAGTYYLRIGYVEVNAEGGITKIENDGVRSSLISHFCAPSSFWYSMI